MTAHALVGSSGAGPGDQGSSTIMVTGVLALCATLALTVLGLGAAITTRHRAESAADLAALAAADVTLGRAEGVPCERATMVSSSNDSTMTDCHVRSDGSVQVSVQLAVPGAFSWLGQARAAARAGAQPTTAAAAGPGAWTGAGDASSSMP